MISPIYFAILAFSASSVLGAPVVADLNSVAYISRILPTSPVTRVGGPISVPTIIVPVHPIAHPSKRQEEGAELIGLEAGELLADEGPGLAAGVETAFDGLNNVFKGANIGLDVVKDKDAIVNTAKTVANDAKSVGNTIADGAKDVANDVKDAGKKVGNALKHLFGRQDGGVTVIEGPIIGGKGPTRPVVPGGIYDCVYTPDTFPCNLSLPDVVEGSKREVTLD